jgi:glycosyltransferase involved in cell wall biosynthesis
VLAYNVGFNREVLGGGLGYFREPFELAALLEAAESNPHDTLRRGEVLRRRASERYRWDDVALGYENLLVSLKDGASNRGNATGRRRPQQLSAPLRTQELR